jgi:hypothetical protein
VRALIIGAGTGIGLEPYRQALAAGQLMTQYFGELGGSWALKINSLF